MIGLEYYVLIVPHRGCILLTIKTYHMLKNSDESVVKSTSELGVEMT